MDASYQILHEKNTVGTCTAVQEGLYIRFSCKCTVPQGEIYTAYLRSEGCEIKLGIPIPEGSGYTLEKRIPAKRIPGGSLSVILRSKADEKKKRFSPIYPDEPFAYLDKLENAFLLIRDGRMGIVIRE